MSITRYGPNHQNKQIFEGAPTGRTATGSTGVEGEFQNVSVTDFNYDEVDQSLGWAEDIEKPVEFADMTAAFSLLLSWMCGRSNTKDHQYNPVAAAGRRAFSLLYLIDPTNCRYDSLDEIAKASGATRAIVSRDLMKLRTELGGILPMKGSGSKENYRKAQLAAVAAGCHSRDRRHDRRSELVSLEAVAD
jgi:hypothetical protein